MLTWSELNDWLALYEVDPWGERRADMRSIVNAAQTNGVKDLDVFYPYVTTDSDDISVDDEAEIMAALREVNQAKNNATTGTTESETDRLG